MSPVFIQLVVGIPERMDKLSRLRHAQRRIVKVERRLWLAGVLMWPTVIAVGVSSVGGLVWFLRRRSAGGRHEMPDTPPAHRALAKIALPALFRAPVGLEPTLCAALSPDGPVSHDGREVEYHCAV